MLECMHCGEKRKTAKGLFWHIVIEHKVAKELAFDQVAVELSEDIFDSFDKEEKQRMDANGDLGI